MGTNYYLRYNVCPHCNHAANELHIGKSSAGWCFSLHVYPEDLNKPQSLDMWKKEFERPDTMIFDEYGDEVGVIEMLDTITSRIGAGNKSFAPYKSRAQLLQLNHAQDGPNNLLRHVISEYCIGHGEGTWDYIVGEFS